MISKIEKDKAHEIKIPDELLFDTASNSNNGSVRMLVYLYFMIKSAGGPSYVPHNFSIADISNFMGYKSRPSKKQGANAKIYDALNWMVREGFISNTETPFEDYPLKEMISVRVRSNWQFEKGKFVTIDLEAAYRIATYNREGSNAAAQTNAAMICLYAGISKSISLFSNKYESSLSSSAYAVLTADQLSTYTGLDKRKIYNMLPKLIGLGLISRRKINLSYTKDSFDVRYLYVLCDKDDQDCHAILESTAKAYKAMLHKGVMQQERLMQLA